ncbi:MAG: thioredoxin family protein [Planctomycetia bacterium]
MLSNRTRAAIVHVVVFGLAGAAPVARADLPAREALVAEAAVPWHADLAAAKQAALVSHRPVLVIFSSGSTESGARLVRDVFPAAETVALLTASFEPVRVDVDVEASTARAMGIAQVPTACIVDAHDRILARFECPTTPAAFVAAASRAVQDAAGTTSVVTPVAAIREHSDFVSQAAQAPPAAPATAAPAGPPAFAQPTDEPTLPAAPPAWPAEQTTRPMPFAPDAPVAQQRPMIDPATSPTGNAAWLNAQPSGAAPGGVATAAPAAAPTSPTPAAPPAPATTPEPEKKSAGASFLAALQKPFSIFTKPKQPDAAATPATPATTATASAAPAAGPDPYGSMPLGLEGFCPVSLVDKGTWVEGRAQWGARHRGRTYLFAGPAQQQAFLADPDRYAPALSGDDPVLACDSGRQVAGQRRYGVTYQARTYLFSSPETRAAFAANPQHYTTRVTIAERPTASGTVVR